MEGKKERVSIFDFDGTLSRGFIWVEFIGYLHKKGIYKDEYYEKQMLTLDEYNRGILPYDKWCDEWGLIWTDALAGTRRDEIARNASEFFREFKNNIYTSSYELVRSVKERGFIPIIVSAAPYEILSLAANDLGIERVYATKLEIREGIYTGKVEVNMFSSEAKERIMDELRRNFNMGCSIGFGDSIGDTGMLEDVNIRVTLNPSDELKKLAEDRGWIIASSGNVVEKVSKRLRNKV